MGGCKDMSLQQEASKTMTGKYMFYLINKIILFASALRNVNIPSSQPVYC